MTGWQLRQEIPQRLPLLSAYVDEVANGAKPLSGVIGLFIQHQQGGAVAMVRALLDLGLRAESIYWVEIPYTSNTTVRQELINIGIPEGNFSISNYNFCLQYETHQVSRVVRALGRIRMTLAAGQTLLVLDSGAYAVHALTQGAALPDRLRIVEQTPRGIFKLRENSTLSEVAMRVPVVNVAESRPKKVLEAPCIGRAFWETLRWPLMSTPWLSRGTTALILGFGALGHVVGLSLKNLGEIAPDRIYIWDPDAKARGRARAMGFRIWDREATVPTVRFNLVIGCSGHRSFTPEDVRHLDDRAALVSASSGAGELSREAFLKAADTAGLPNRILGREQLCELPLHSDLEIQLYGHRVSFFNGGFPVSFDGRINNVPPDYIQVTLALMVAGAVQAVQTERAGVHSFDKVTAEWIETRFPTTDHLVDPSRSSE